MASAVKRPKRRHWRHGRWLHFYGIPKRVLHGYRNRLFSDQIFDGRPFSRKAIDG